MHVKVAHPVQYSLVPRSGAGNEIVSSRPRPFEVEGGERAKGVGTRLVRQRSHDLLS